jgi:uncharacterized membrane protein (UPF0127 family)
MLHRRRLALLAALFPSALGAQPGVNQPQPRLPTEPLVIETGRGPPLRFTVEMAISSEHQMIGLMFRPEVAPDEGMLFDWGAPRESAMWMRNTITPLDMVFIRADGRIHRIAERTVPLSLATIESRGPVRATLELAAGTAARLDIRPGDLVRQRIFGNAP